VRTWFSVCSARICCRGVLRVLFRPFHFFGLLASLQCVEGLGGAGAAQQPQQYYEVIQGVSDDDDKQIMIGV